MIDGNSTCQYPHGGLYSEPVRYGLGGTAIALEVFTVICNSIIIAAFARVKDLRKTCNVLIINIVVGDLFYCFTCGFDVMTLFYTGLLCNADFITARRLFRYTSAYLNVLNISAVACERFIAIQFPYRYTTHVTYPRCIAVAVGIWIVSGFTSTIREYISFMYVEPPLALTLLVVVVVFYARIYVVTRRHIVRDLGHGVRVRHSKAMAAVLSAAVFGLCWSPIVCLLMMKFIFGIAVPLSLTTSVSLLFGSCFNIFIYTYRMDDFRKGVKHVLHLDRNSVHAANTDLKS